MKYKLSQLLLPILWDRPHKVMILRRISRLEVEWFEFSKRICYSKLDRTLIIVMVVTVAMKILATTVMVMMKMSRKKRSGLEWFE